MRHSTIIRITTLLVSFGLSGVGCGDDSGRDPDGGLDGGPGPDVEVQGYQCTKDPELILTRTECRLDVQCPCGTHCERGLCRHECLEHADCDGWCDFLGRCRDLSDTHSIPGVAATEPSQILLSPVSLPIHDWNLETVKTVTLRAPASALQDVRLVASEGLEVSCDTEFSSECVLAQVPAGGEEAIRLRVVRQSGAERQAWTLTVHVGNQIEVVGLKKVRPPVVTPVEYGVYEGRIWVSEAWATLTTDLALVDEDLSSAFRMLDLPLSVKIYPDGTMVLSDPAGILPSDWVFVLQSDGTFDALDGQDDRSRRIYVGGATTVGPTTTEVTVAGEGALHSFEGGARGSLTMRVGGLGLVNSPATLVDERQRVVWSFALTRAGDIPTGDTPPAVGSGDQPGFSGVEDRYADPLPWEAETAACFVSGTDFTGIGTGLPASIQGALCFNHGSDLGSVPFMASDAANLNSSADLLCADPGSPTAPADNYPTAFPFFTYGSRSVVLTPPQLLQHCLDDLAHAQSDPPTPAGQNAACLNELSGCGADGSCDAGELPRCLDAPLAVRAVALGMTAIERQGLPDQIHWTVSDPDGVKLGLRALQQWLQVHTFVAREAAQETDQYLGAMDRSGLEQALARSISGWDLVLHPRVASRLLHVPAALLNDPDYRGASFAPGTMSQEVTQAVGIPVVILETLRAQLEATTQLVYLTRFSGGSLPDTVGDTMRRVAVVAPLAQLLHQRAADAGPPPWDSLWAESRDRFDQAMRELVGQWRALRKGENPLGIEDKDLPLYRGLTNPDAAGQRFEAISTYIMENFAEPAVAAAASAKAAADAAWDLLLQRQIQADQQSQATDREAEIKRLYGEKILTLCGNPHDLRADEVFDETSWPGLNPDSCFLDPVTAVCQFNEQAFLDSLSRDDVGYHLCVQSRLKEQLGDRASLAAEDVDEWVDTINGSIREHYGQTLVDYMPETGEQWWQTFDPGFVEMINDQVVCTKNRQCAVNDLFTLSHNDDPGTEDAQAYEKARQSCQSTFGGRETLAERANQDPALDLPDCYLGSMGELALAARSASKDMETATSALEDYTSKYRAALWKCTIDDRALEMSEAVTDQLDALQDKLETYTGNLSNTISVGRGVISAVPTFIGVMTGNAESREQVLNSTFDLATGWLTGAFDEVSGVNEVKDLHQAFLTDFEDQVADAKCFHDAEMHLIGADTQARRVEKARLDLSRALLKLRNAKAEVSRLLKEGRYRANAVATQTRMSLFHDVWKDLWAGSVTDHQGKVETYRRKMRLAQRMLYLAVRAVEYELQVPQGSLRQAVLEARAPADLDQVVTQLNAVIGAGNIGGQSPGNRHAEFSLKENLLQLADRSDLPPELNTMSDTERFRAMLASPRFAHHNAQGEYDGQLVPFSLAPLGTLKLGDPGTIHLLTGAECAERTWSVTASLQGTDLTDDNNTYLQVGVLQKNDFYSQWCLNPTAEQGEVQLASVRPARNLFIDPVWGGDYGATNPSESEYVISLVDAYFNVSWNDFTSPDYDAGSDTALACRGLYGEYAIFLPAQILNIDDSGGLHLRRVDDIWLRFDYVSAAKQWQ